MDGHKLERILIPLDGSDLAETVIPHAIIIARSFGAAAVLMRSVNGRLASNGGVDSVAWRMERAEACTYLRGVAGRFEEAGIEAETYVEVGKASEQILRAISARNTDLVLLCSHGRGGLTKFPLSGTVVKVLSFAPVSVMIVRADITRTQHPYLRVFVPSDCSPRSDWAACLAASVARASGARLELVHVVPQPEVTGEPAPDSEPMQLARRLAEHNRAVAVRHLDELRSRLAAPDLEVAARVVEDGHVGRRLQELADAEPQTLMMLSAHGSSPGTGWPCGGLPAALIEHGRTPVLMLQDVRRHAGSGTLEFERPAVRWRRRAWPS